MNGLYEFAFQAYRQEPIDEKGLQVGFHMDCVEYRTDELLLDVLGCLDSELL